LSALYPATGPLSLLVLAEIGLFGVLFSTTVSHHAPGRLAVSSLVAGIVIGVTGWFVLRTGTALWIVASLFVVGTAVGTYGLHRYERVTLGLVESDEREHDAGPVRPARRRGYFAGLGTHRADRSARGGKPAASRGVRTGTANTVSTNGARIGCRRRDRSARRRV